MLLSDKKPPFVFDAYSLLNAEYRRILADLIGGGLFHENNDDKNTNSEM